MNYTTARICDSVLVLMRTVRPYAEFAAFTFV